MEVSDRAHRRSKNGCITELKITSGMINTAIEHKLLAPGAIVLVVGKANGMEQLKNGSRHNIFLQDGRLTG